MARDVQCKIEFFRTRHGVEVDFIVTLDGKTWAIEVKAGDVAEQDLTGLKAFKEYYPNVHRLIAVTGNSDRKRSRDGILICDWITLLKEMGL